MAKTTIHFLSDKASGIAVIHNAIPLQTCENLVRLCTSAYDKVFYPGPTIGGLSPNIKSTMDLDFSRSALKDKGIEDPAFGICEDEVSVGLYSAIALYVEQFPELYEVTHSLVDTGYRLQRYEPRKGFYRSHVDGAPWVSPPINTRVLGVVMYLNTVESGGGTAFPMHDVIIPATAGSISIFPAYWTHPHQGCVPISGDKWMISTFMECPEPKPKPQYYECQTMPRVQETSE